MKPSTLLAAVCAILLAVSGTTAGPHFSLKPARLKGGSTLPKGSTLPEDSTHLDSPYGRRSDKSVDHAFFESAECGMAVGDQSGFSSCFPTISDHEKCCSYESKIITACSKTPDCMKPAVQEKLHRGFCSPNTPPLN